MRAVLGPSRRAFTMVELATVLVIIGVIAVIAVPRFGQAAERARRAALKDTLRVLSNAVDHYRAEHGNVSPGHMPDGTVVAGGNTIVRRLTEKTDERGSLGGLFGPYLLRFPVNPNNGLATVRIDGVAAGANLAGWRYSSARNIFQADDGALSAAITPGDLSHLAGGKVLTEAEAATLAEDLGK